MEMADRLGGTGNERHTWPERQQVWLKIVRN